MKTIVAFLLVAGLAACNDHTGDTGSDASRPDAHAMIDAGAPDADCVANPVSSTDILNACTTAQRVPKHPATGCWYADGGLPPPP